MGKPQALPGEVQCGESEIETDRLAGGCPIALRNKVPYHKKRQRFPSARQVTPMPRRRCYNRSGRQPRRPLRAIVFFGELRPATSL